MSKILQTVQHTAKGLYNAGVMDRFTFLRIEELCLTPLPPMPPQEIRQLRTQHHLSQAVFAYYLNVKTVTVKKWESGKNSPAGPSLKLLHLLKHKGLEPLQF